MLKFSGLLIGIIAVSGALSYALTSPKVVQVIAAKHGGEYTNASNGYASGSSCSMSKSSCPMSMVESACAGKALYEEKQAAYDASVASMQMQHEMFMAVGLSHEEDILFDPDVFLATPEKPKSEVTVSLDEVWPDTAMDY